MIIIRDLGLADYQWYGRPCNSLLITVSNTADEIWLLQHPAVFTQGQAGKAEHMLAPGDIPVIQVDRVGVTSRPWPVSGLLVDRFTAQKYRY